MIACKSRTFLCTDTIGNFQQEVVTNRESLRICIYLMVVATTFKVHSAVFIHHHYILCCQNESALVEAALRELPTRTESEVRAHSAWYTEYSSLLEAKRLAIQQWKKNKQVTLL